MGMRSVGRHARAAWSLAACALAACGGPLPPSAATAAPSAKVVLFAGQSNALGLHNTGPAPYAPTGRVRIWTGRGFNDMRPGVNTGTAANPNAWGPEVRFASDWLAANPSGTLYIAKVVKGETPLAQRDGLDWSPGSAGEMFDAASAAAHAVRARLGVAKLDAVFWMQGEQDATRADWAGAYDANLTRFVAAVRAEWIGDAQGYIGLGRIGGGAALPYAPQVRRAQGRVDQADPHMESFETLGFARHADGIHLAAAGQLALGHGFFEAWAN